MTHADIVDDVHRKILKEWTAEELNEFFLTGLRDDYTLSRFHTSLGRDIRNEYNLWSIPWVPEMGEYCGCLCDMSPYHPDNVSGTIIKEVWKKGPHGKTKSTS